MRSAFPSHRVAARRRLGLALVAISAASALLAGPTAPATSAEVTTTPVMDAATASTATSMASQVIGWLNRDRVAAGLAPYRSWGSLAAIATQRAGRMASSGVLSHAAAGGDVGAALTAAGIGWSGFGEIIGESGYPWGTKAAANLYSMWKSSPIHHSIMFSARNNYVGPAFVRDASGRTWASIVFTESADHTAAVASNGHVWRSGRTVSYSWHGYDPRLQTHTAGLRGFDVEYRVDGGAWHLIRHSTLATALSLRHRPHHHWYAFRVRASDRRGNLSGWTAAKRIWVP